MQQRKISFFFNINPIKKAILFLKNFSYGGQAPPLNTSPQTIACKVIFCPPRQKWYLRKTIFLRFSEKLTLQLHVWGFKFMR